MSAGGISPPENLQIIHTEKSMDISWDPVPGADGYNLYTSTIPEAPDCQKIRINQEIIRSGNRFTYLWHFENGERVRKIKGLNHFISVTSVFEQSGKTVESEFSDERDNRFFEGFGRIGLEINVEEVLIEKQHTEPLPVNLSNSSASDFISFMNGPGKSLHNLLKEQIDFTQLGACLPVSTILVKLLEMFGLESLRADGHFIREFHSFVIIKIDNVEYVLDFTADQFVPDVSPVLIPRDFCHLDHNGRLNTEGQAVYSIARIYSSQQINLSEDSSADIYREMYEKIVSEYR
ncbi:hypothetical protein CHISP_3715 [Chitinispirillum alkaliphilum]|nr:hypothetical protein CHISP_3715 [Chitinispirillum alkaliphilum]